LFHKKRNRKTSVYLVALKLSSQFMYFPLFNRRDTLFEKRNVKNLRMQNANCENNIIKYLLLTSLCILSRHVFIIWLRTQTEEMW